VSVRPVVLSIAGSDPSGGAGIQADLKAVEACGGWGATAVTAITVQNTRGVRRVRALEADLVREQIEALFDDLDVAAVKSGMLGTAAIVVAVAETLRARRTLPYVLDPVVRASDGTALLDDPAIEALKRSLIPCATLLTPNVEDVRALTGLTVRDAADAERAGRRLLETGCGAVLVKGGHLDLADATDVLVHAGGTETFVAPRVDTEHTHGTGCVLAAAVATGLARGSDLAAAIREAKRFVGRCLRHGLALGGGRGPIDPMFERVRRGDDVLDGVPGR